VIKVTKQSSSNLKLGMLVPFLTTEKTSDIGIVLSIEERYDSFFYIKVLVSNLKIYIWRPRSNSEILIYE
jgi:hypothetical protein